MKESKKSIFITIIIILLILLIISIFMLFKSNNIENNEVNPELTNKMADSIEANIIDENKTIDNVTADNKTTNSEDKASNNVAVSSEEKSKIKQYIDIICNRPNCCRLPEFNSITNADKDWIYLHVDREKYEQYATEQEILENLKEVFGNELKIDIKADQKNIPTDRFSGIPCAANEEGKYLLPIWGDTAEYLYTINNIKKENNRYIVNVIEYCADLVNENPYERAVFCFRENAENKLIFRLDNEQDAKDSKVIDKVMQNKNEFPSYDVVLKSDNGKLLVEKIAKN